uniref:Uncharacterized protein n=1 Tax=Physcomitrium patens TaxID=3218 RepID=A0A7I4B764_PHYPA
MRTLSWEATAPRSILLGISWAHGSPGMLFGSSQVRAHRLERLGRAALISCRCAAANSFNYPSVEDERPVSPQQCTYGALNVLWVASELKRLLTMQNLGDGLVLTRGQWSWDVQERTHYHFKGLMQFCNTSSRFELFVPEVSAKLQLLSNSSVDSITATVKIFSQHPNEKLPKRDDGYWRAYITRAGESTAMQVEVDLQAKDEKALAELQAWLLNSHFFWQYVLTWTISRMAHMDGQLTASMYYCPSSTHSRHQVMSNGGSWRKLGVFYQSVLIFFLI